MGSVIKRVSQGAGNRLCPFFKLFVIARVAGDVSFVNAVGSHRPPLVMVACQPPPGYVFEQVVFGNESGGQMTVVIINGHLLGVFVIKPASDFALQKKIFG